MFGRAEAQHWEHTLDAYAEVKDHGFEALHEIRDRWVTKVGWLTGRTAAGQHMMQD